MIMLYQSIETFKKSKEILCPRFLSGEKIVKCVRKAPEEPFVFVFLSKTVSLFHKEHTRAIHKCASKKPRGRKRSSQTHLFNLFNLI